MKTEKQQPWGKWFWGDWRKDARLRRCGYAARGLWADMLSLMGGECDRFGYLMMEGQALGASDLVGLLGGSERDVAKFLAELETKAVFSRTGAEFLEPDLLDIIDKDLPTGIIFSRRMVRDKAKAERDRENGKTGGNPTLKGSAPKTTPQDNGGVNPPDNAQSQKPESETIDTKKEAPTVPVVPVVSKPLPIQIPSFVPVEPWEAFVAMRKAKKRPMSDYALKLMFSKLSKLRAASEDIAAVLNQSTLNGWQDVFAVKPEGGRNGQQPANRSFGSAVSHAVRKRAGEGLFPDGDAIAGELIDQRPESGGPGENRLLGRPIAAE